MSLAARAEDRGSDDDSGWRWANDSVDNPNSFAIFGGSGTERTFSETLSNLFSYDTSGDRVIAVAGRRQIAWYKDHLSVDLEVSFSHHFGREVYEELGMAGYVRWHDFPWSDHLTTSFGVGLGPSYTTIYPELETQDDPSDSSKLLNQLNLELSLGLPEYPRTSLVARLQHRSGVFGLFNGVTDASNFLMLGVEYRF